jgi:hypothetical protein
MSYSRYQNRNKTISMMEPFREQEVSQDETIVTHYQSSQNILDKTKQNFPYSEYQWKYGDKLYKLAQIFYGDSRLWWIIAHVNMKPTDSDYEPGDVLLIPNRNSLDMVIEMLGY